MVSRKGGLLFAAAAVFLSLSLTGRSATRAERQFIFRYSFSVRRVPQGQRLRVWVPLAHSDENQQIRILSLRGDLPLRKTKESVYGNEMLYAETVRSDKPEYSFSIEYGVVRKERTAFREDELARQQPPALPLREEDLALFLRPDGLVPVTGLPAELAARAVAGQSTPLEKARAIYGYVLNHMRYDKTGEGWGRGDTLYACAAKKGNCTDFHSLFLSMARSQGIPARFEIGFPLPEDQRAGQIAGYHCWADFYLQGYGWVPVDISEAWKHKDKKDYFFGSHDANRVQLSVGRDLLLNPKQDGRPLNYFIYPHAELDGREYSGISSVFSFAE